MGEKNLFKIIEFSEDKRSRIEVSRGVNKWMHGIVVKEYLRREMILS